MIFWQSNSFEPYLSPFKKFLNPFNVQKIDINEKKEI